MAFRPNTTAKTRRLSRNSCNMGKAQFGNGKLPANVIREWLTRWKSWTSTRGSKRCGPDAWKQLLARHWPEILHELTLASSTLAYAIEHYGRPQDLAADERAAERLRAWGRGPLKQTKIDRIIAATKTTVGVPMTDEDVNWLREIVTKLQDARAAQKECRREIKTLVSQHETIQQMASAVGEATACVLWVQLGDPRNYPSAGAYLKAAGLNLKVRSSGKMKGQLRITRRGPSRVRRWMYFAALRAVQEPSVKPWFEARRKRRTKRRARCWRRLA